MVPLGEGGQKEINWGKEKISGPFAPGATTDENAAGARRSFSVIRRFEVAAGTAPPTLPFHF